MPVKKLKQNKKMVRTGKEKWEDRMFAGINFKTREVIYADGRREKIPTYVDINKVGASFTEEDE